MAVSRPSNTSSSSDPQDQGVSFSATNSIAMSGLEQSTQFQMVQATPPELPLMTKYLGQYSVQSTKTQVGGTHPISEYKKSHSTKQKPFLFKEHKSKRMAEIEACNFDFVRLIAPHKSPKAVSIVNQDNCYQYAGIMMEKIPFVPYAKRRLRKENLELPKILQQQLLGYQATLLTLLTSLKKVYEEKRNAQASTSKPSQSSWLGSISIAVSAVTTYSADFYNSYYSETSSGLVSLFNQYLFGKKLTEESVTALQLAIIKRKTYLESLKRPPEETQAEMNLITQIEHQTQLIKAHQSKKMPISIIEQLENIHTQCNKIAPPDHLIYNIGSHLLHAMISYRQLELNDVNKHGFLAKFKLDQEKLSSITEKNIQDIQTLVQQLREYRRNHSLNSAISESLNKQDLANKKLPTLSIHFDSDGKPTYSIKQPNSTMDLLGILEHAKNSGKLAEHIYNGIVSNLVDGNKLLTCAVLAAFFPVLIKTEVKAQGVSTEQSNLCLDHQDIDNYAIRKGLAECLVINMLLKENDLHGGNFDIYGNLLDPDMKMWDVAYTYKLQDENFLNSSLRKPSVNSFALSSRTIANLPHVYEDGYYFWPTKSDSLRSTAKMVAGSTSQANEFTAEDNQNFSQLATDPIFIFHKFKTLTKFILMDTSLFEEVAKSHIDTKPDGGHLLKEMTNSITSRVKETKTVLNDMPEYHEFMQDYGKYALHLIKREMKEQRSLLEQRIQRAREKNNKQKIAYLERMLKGIENSISNIADQKRLLTHHKSSNSIATLQSSAASEPDHYISLSGLISPLASSPSQKGLFGSTNSLPAPQITFGPASPNN